jgi:hypothetical protein
VIELPADHALKLLKLLYGLCDAEDHWSRTYHKHLMEDLKLKPIVNDLSLFFKAVDENLQDLCATYVDDSLTAGTPYFLAQTTLMERTFESKPQKFVNVTYSGVYIHSDNKYFHAEMNAYIDKLEPLHGDKIPYNMFTSPRAKLLCVSTVRPDILCAVSLATQVTPDLYTQNEVIKLNKVLEHAKNYKKFQLSYPPLD